MGGSLQEIVHCDANPYEDQHRDYDQNHAVSLVTVTRTLRTC